jgi:hypothetical protein
MTKSQYYFEMKMRQISKTLGEEILLLYWSIITVNKFFGMKTQDLVFKISPLQDHIHKTPIIIYVKVH